MINQDIVAYLEEGLKRGFRLSLLKEKLLEAGFNRKEVDESAASLSKKQIVREEKHTKPHERKKEFKLMKFVGWCGILLLAISLVFSIVNLIYPIVQNSNGAVIFGIVGILFVLLNAIYFFGFTKMGKVVEVKTLRIGAWMMISSILLSIVFSLIGGSLITNNNAITILSVFFVVLMLVGLIGYLLFAIGLIKAGKHVKSAKMAGILGLVSLLGFVVLLVIIIVMIFSAGVFDEGSVNTFALLSLVSSLWLLSIFAIGLGLARIVGKILEIRSLFKASKKFEGFHSS